MKAEFPGVRKKLVLGKQPSQGGLCWAVGPGLHFLPPPRGCPPAPPPLPSLALRAPPTGAASPGCPNTHLSHVWPPAPQTLSCLVETQAPASPSLAKPPLRLTSGAPWPGTPPGPEPNPAEAPGCACQWAAAPCPPPHPQAAGAEHTLSRGPMPLLSTHPWASSPRPQRLLLGDLAPSQAPPPASLHAGLCPMRPWT